MQTELPRDISAFPYMVLRELTGAHKSWTFAIMQRKILKRPQVWTVLHISEARQVFIMDTLILLHGICKPSLMPQSLSLLSQELTG